MPLSGSATFVPDLQSHARPTLCLSDCLGQMEIAINQLLSGTFKRDTGGCRRSKPSPAQPSPPLPLADAKHKHLLACKARGKGGLGNDYAGQMAHERGWYGW